MLDIQQQAEDIHLLTAEMQLAINEEEWDKATRIFQRRDHKIHQLFDQTEALSDNDYKALREMIHTIQNSDEAVIEKIVIQKNKLLTDVLDASASQKALEAYSKNI
ncbi:MAG: flagellar protein FliT [Gammaproteobacteria bacterium]|nr:flagellar protein FliT [Gammaproteobacteria bacterium]